MNLVLFLLIAAVSLSPTQAQTVSSTTIDLEQIKQINDNNNTFIQFVDKKGRVIKNVNVGTSETTTKIPSRKEFNPTKLRLPISTKTISIIELMRKEDERDIILLRRELKEPFIRHNGKFVVIEENVYYFIEYDNANDSERADSPTELQMLTTIYDISGNKIFELTQKEGYRATVSNTGNFFLISLGEYGPWRLVTKSKKALAEFPGSISYICFSKTDKYIFVVQFDPEKDTEMAILNIVDTSQVGRPPLKIRVPWSMFSANESPVIDEENRTLTVQHAWEPATREAKVDSIRF